MDSVPAEGRVFEPLLTDPELGLTLCMASTWRKIVSGVSFLRVNWSLAWIVSTANFLICNRIEDGRGKATLDADRGAAGSR